MERIAFRVTLFCVVLLTFFSSSVKSVNACSLIDIVGRCFLSANKWNVSLISGSPRCNPAVFDCCPIVRVGGNMPMACGILDPTTIPPDGGSEGICYQHMNTTPGGEETWCFQNKLIPTSTPFPTPLPININCKNSNDINTQIGCIPADNPNDTAVWFFYRIFAVVSAIAFFVMVSGGVEIATSAGNPDKVKHGRENITAALAGLIFILLTIFLLRFIGVDIIKIPGFAK